MSSVTCMQTYVHVYILIRRMCYATSSPTELDNKDATKLFKAEPSRVVRIARGAGLSHAHMHT